MNLQHDLDFITEIAYQAGRITPGCFNTGIKADLKSDLNPVTASDQPRERLHPAPRLVRCVWLSGGGDWQGRGEVGSSNANLGLRPVSGYLQGSGGFLAGGMVWNVMLMGKRWPVILRSRMFCWKPSIID